MTVSRWFEVTLEDSELVDKPLCTIGEKTKQDVARAVVASGRNIVAFDDAWRTPPAREEAVAAASERRTFGALGRPRKSSQEEGLGKRIISTPIRCVEREAKRGVRLVLCMVQLEWEGMIMLRVVP
jgi:hypothetical protein